MSGDKKYILMPLFTDDFGPNTPVSSHATTTVSQVTEFHRNNCEEDTLKTTLVLPNDHSKYYRMHHSPTWLEEIRRQHSAGDWFGLYKPASFEDGKKYYNLPPPSNSKFLIEFYFDVPFEHPEFCYMESHEIETAAWQGLLTDRLITTIKILSVYEYD